MIVYPAIDVMGGVAVRLRQGDPASGARVGDDPVAVARRWAADGAEWLHVVDLDGAFAGEPRHTILISQICRAVGVPVQVGGGLRTMAHLDEVFDAGATRAVLGTAALDEAALRGAVRAYAANLAVSLDAREGRVAVAGWTKTTAVSVLEAAVRLRDAGVQRLVYTDVSRDGMLSGPNLDGLRDMIAAASLPVIASGGVAGRDDVSRLARAGAEGVIIGRALYDGRLALADALDAARQLV